MKKNETAAFIAVAMRVAQRSSLAVAVT